VTAATVDRGTRSRRAILDAAKPIFERDGYAAASLNQIIAASGLTKGGFYFHFASKQALALAVLADHHAGWNERVRRETEHYPRAIDRLFATPRIIARLAASGDGPVALRRLTEELARDPALRDEVCGSIRSALEATAAQFAEAQAEGTIRADLDPYQTAQTAVGGFVGAQALTDQLGDARLAERVEALVRFMRAAIEIRPAAAPSVTEEGDHDVV
jgi:AcrR family transcriptional regulator